LSEDFSLREKFKRLANQEYILVHITAHAFSRLKERKVRDYRKLNKGTLKNIILNTIRDGRYKIGKSDIKIATKKYVLACTIQENKLVVKTVMQVSKEFWEKFCKKAKLTPWKKIIID